MLAPHALSRGRDVCVLAPFRAAHAVRALDGHAALSVELPPLRAFLAQDALIPLGEPPAPRTRAKSRAFGFALLV